MPVALLSARLGLPGNCPEVIELYTNKKIMYDYAQSLDIPVPAFTEVESVEEIEKFMSLHELPLIIKPTASTSSRGFVKITKENRHNCSAYLADCLTYSTSAVMQRFIAGHEVTVEGVCTHHNHMTLTTSSKKHFRPGIASSLKYPAQIPDSILQKITRYNDLFVDSSGLQFGNTHAEYMIDEDGQPWLMEIAARGGGCGIPSGIVPWVTGLSLHDILLSNLTKNPTEVWQLVAGRQKSAVLQFYEFPSGRCDIEQELVADRIRNIPGVHYWHFNFMEHQYLKPASTDQDRHAMAILHGENDEEINNTLLKIEEVLYEKRNHQED